MVSSALDTKLGFKLTSFPKVYLLLRCSKITIEKLLLNGRADEQLISAAAISHREFPQSSAPTALASVTRDHPWVS